MIWIPPKYEWASSRPLLWSPNLCVFASLIHTDDLCVQNCKPQPTPHLGFFISANHITIHPFAQIRKLKVIFNPSSPPSSLHFQFIISASKCISNVEKARMWSVSTYLAHEDITFPLFFFFFRAQNGNIPQFKKVVFQEFTDGSFTQPLYRGELNEHLGLLGPCIRAEVQDNIMVSWGQWNHKKINPVHFCLWL